MKPPETVIWPPPILEVVEGVATTVPSTTTAMETEVVEEASSVARVSALAPSESRPMVTP